MGRSLSTMHTYTHTHATDIVTLFQKVSTKFTFTLKRISSRCFLITSIANGFHCRIDVLWCLLFHFKSRSQLDSIENNLRLYSFGDAFTLGAFSTSFIELYNDACSFFRCFFFLSLLQINLHFAQEVL